MSKEKTHLIRRELAARKLASKHLLPFIMRMQPDYMPGWIHKDIATRLEQFLQDVEDLKSPRLILNIPPRHGKSVIGSQYFPAWALGKRPKLEVITCSHTASLAEEFSRQTRDLLKEQRFKQVFEKVGLDKDKQNATGWKTGHGGGYLPAGVGGPILGRGAHILVIDDPFKNFDEAYSEIQRERIWNWFTTTAMTRLAPGAGVLVIMQRWHFDDISGRLIERGEKGEGDKYEVVTYPAIAEENEKYRRKGEALHPDRYPLQTLLSMKRTMNPRDWMALYQQQPVAAEGEYFKKDTFKFYDELPPVLNKYSAFDLAIGQKETNDYTVGVTVGIDELDNMYVLDLVRGRWDAHGIVDEILLNHKKHKPHTIAIEKGHLSMAIDPFLRKRIAEEKQYTINVKDMATGRRDKEARARAIQGRMSQGRVYFPREAEWMEGLMAEMLQFPAGKHDDQVDALAWIGLLLEELGKVIPEAAPDPDSIGWRKQLRKFIKNDHNPRSMMSS